MRMMMMRQRRTTKTTTTIMMKLQLLLLTVVLLQKSERASAFSTPAQGIYAQQSRSFQFQSPRVERTPRRSNSISKRSRSGSTTPSSSRLSSSSPFGVNGSIATNDGNALDLSASDSDSDSNSAAAPSSTDMDGTITASSTSSSYPPLSGIKAQFVRAGMMTFILSMCVALPVTLFPQYVAYKLGLLKKTRKERLALSTGQFCARWLIRIIPFCNLQAESEMCTSSTSENGKESDELPEPAVWVCNHTSMLDVFLLMAADRKLRGRNKRPMKIVYWQQLEDNPVTKLLFRQAGFIPVQMAPGVPGTANDYDISSFKRLLKDSKQAFAEGFDIGILPEGQLNPNPELGLLPIFSGAFTLARLSKRPVHLMAMHGAHHLWHPIQGMHVTGRRVKVRAYHTPRGRTFASAAEFCQTFQQVVGHFGTLGHDLPAAELNEWLTGQAWEKSVQNPSNQNKQPPPNSSNDA